MSGLNTEKPAMNSKRPLSLLSDELISQAENLKRLTAWVRSIVEQEYHEDLFASQLTDGILVIVTTSAVIRMALLAKFEELISGGLNFKGQRVLGVKIKVVPKQSFARVAKHPPLERPSEDAQKAILALAAQEDDPELRKVLERLAAGKQKSANTTK